jgi:hypothetical protein
MTINLASIISIDAVPIARHGRSMQGISLPAKSLGLLNDVDAGYRSHATAHGTPNMQFLGSAVMSMTASIMLRMYASRAQNHFFRRRPPFMLGRHADHLASHHTDEAIVIDASTECVQI